MSTKTSNLKPWPKGVSGNPSGRPRVIGELRDLAREHTAEAIQTMLDVMRDESAPPAARIAAATHLLDRGYGKPTQIVDATVGDGKQLADLSDAELLTIIASGARPDEVA